MLLCSLLRVRGSSTVDRWRDQLLVANRFQILLDWFRICSDPYTEVMLDNLSSLKNPGKVSARVSSVTWVWMLQNNTLQLQPCMVWWPNHDPTVWKWHLMAFCIQWCLHIWSVLKENCVLLSLKHAVVQTMCSTSKYQTTKLKTTRKQKRESTDTQPELHSLGELALSEAWL